MDQTIVSWPDYGCWDGYPAPLERPAEAELRYEDTMGAFHKVQAHTGDMPPEHTQPGKEPELMPAKFLFSLFATPLRFAAFLCSEKGEGMANTEPIENSVLF
jgi:hypothetical protein